MISGAEIASGSKDTLWGQAAAAVARRTARDLAPGGAWRSEREIR